ncbi:hypothetical protein [Kingella potus]|uniref:hypothetical protein n=1 Tax=Kingella potus TaxID=265175 RepID=UPI000E1C3975|nr:hypothetical protein [Kingella potus]UOP01185.1 hypothetical protein LVJ84_02425 [Kingella potus]
MSPRGDARVPCRNERPCSLRNCVRGRSTHPTEQHRPSEKHKCFSDGLCSLSCLRGRVRVGAVAASAVLAGGKAVWQTAPPRPSPARAQGRVQVCGGFFGFQTAFRTKSDAASRLFQAAPALAERLPSSSLSNNAASPAAAAFWPR